MRKQIRLLIVATMLLFVAQLSFAQEMSITFTTTKITDGQYNPDHVMAIWIKKANSQYVRTLMVYATERKSYLYQWKASSGGDDIDAITGSTLRTQETLNVIWNMKNFANMTVPDGDYLLCMEICSSDTQGPYSEIPFAINGADFTLNPPDISNFKDIELLYENGAASTQTVELEQKFVKVFPNAIDKILNAEVVNLADGDVTFSVYDDNQRKIGTKTLSLLKGTSTVDLSDIIVGSSTGIYFLVTETNQYTISNKWIKK